MYARRRVQTPYRDDAVSAQSPEDVYIMDRSRNLAAALAAVTTVAACAAAPGAAWAQSKKPLNAAERQPTLTGVAAAGATHHALKASARAKKRSGRHLSFAERHPTLTAIGAGAATHHALKHSAHNKGHHL
jgi:hypothetical protein